ncbi:general transcription factor II-I repeat domain-containing protein 2A-like [Engraulis encrasicolus]|uniref:general transcription factor II-I repeat domain-containing protein 2A-like n=1 Tax=Engraulis encrasicolus TaxID=184585 RepID=UPI002FD5D9C5
MAKAFGDNNTAKNFEAVSLSRRTVTRRIFDIHNHVDVKMKQVMQDCKYFSLALDESTDVTDVSQLMVFARTIDNAFDVHEELLKLASLHDTTKGSDIFNAVTSAVGEYGGFEKLSTVVTDGAPAMQGRHRGFAGLLRQSGVNCPILHCIVHQEALCAKTLDFGHVMELVTKVTNLIRGGNRSLSHRRFITFLDEVDAEYGDLQLHTDIRWMSRGKCLERFFALRSEIPVFLENSVSVDTSAYCAQLKDTRFVCDMAFLTDISAHLNHLNTLLQGRDQTVCDLYSHMTAFQRKLGLFIDGFSSPRVNLAHFPACDEIRKANPRSEKQIQKYKADLEKLQEQFNDRFQDFHEMQPRIALFTDPLSAVVSAQPSELQLELCELQADPFFQAKRNERGISFWRLLPEARFPRLRDFALSMASMFGSTYICESSFSTMKHIKSKERNRLTDDTLFHLMRIGTTNIDIDIQSIVSQQAKPQLSH